MNRIHTLTEKYSIIIAIVTAAIVLMVLSYAGRIMIENHSSQYRAGQQNQIGALQ